MGIPLISNIEQANNGEFWLVDSNSIYGGLYHVDTIEQRDSLPKQRLKVGMLCYVLNTDMYYKYNSSNVWEEFSAGGVKDSEFIDEEEKQNMKDIFKVNED